jgi:hypothetical protein
MSGITRSLFIEGGSKIGDERAGKGLYHPHGRTTIAEPAWAPKSSVTRRAAAGASLVIYVLAALLPPIGLLLNGQPFSAFFNLVLIVFCVVFGLIFSHSAAGPVGARHHCHSHEAGGAPAPRSGGGDPPVRPAAWLRVLAR